MKKLLLLACAFAGVFTAPAVAADLARPRPVYAPPVAVPVPLFTWTGCYIGANGGGIWAHRDWSDPIFGFGGFGTENVNGGLGGVQGGCDYQVGHWLIGAAGDWDWTSASSSTANTVFPLLTEQSKLKSLESLTLRVGYAWDRFLVYLKGGSAWVQSDLSLQFAGNTFATVSESASVRRWTIGVGGEYAFLNWLSGFVEYDYYNLRDNRENFACGVAACPAIGILPVTVESKINVIKAGLNVRFGPGARW